MIVAINYADYKYKQTQKFNSATAIDKGKVDKVISYSPKDIDKEFRQKNINILSRERGNGYWLWKPYFILKTLHTLRNEDYLVYLDSGAFYINDVRYLIKQMEKDDQCVMSFELPFRECCYTKRDVFVCMECDESQYINTNQRMATMIVIKKTEEAMKFVREWLSYGQTEDIITDAKNHLGKDNYAGFVDNRHDQSIFSVLSKKYGIKAYRDPSQFGRFPDIFWNEQIQKLEKLEDDSTYPQIIVKHGMKKVIKRMFWEQMMLAHMPKSIVKWYVHSKMYYGIKNTGEKIAVLTDNMPIKENAYGYGMYKVVHRLVKALGSNVDTVICTDRNYCDKKVDGVIYNKLLLVNKFHNIKMTALEDVYFLLEMLSVVISLRQKKIRKIFIPLGADYKELKRAYLLSVVYHIPVSVYIVDDFVEYYNNVVEGKRNKVVLKKSVIRYLKKLDNIFVISEGMRDRINDLTNRKSIVLPIPYEWRKLVDTDKKDKQQIMFIGSISDLYLQGIRDIAKVIDKINTEAGRNIRLLFTYHSAAEVRHKIGNYECIDSGNIATEKELRKEMRDSLFCFMPYSDNEKFKLMQNTSFPSKLIEYMSSARSIVIYGNYENSAQRYFEENNLPQVIYGRDAQLLRECIMEHITDSKNYSQNYINILRKNHSFENIRKRILMSI